MFMLYIYCIFPGFHGSWLWCGEECLSGLQCLYIRLRSNRVWQDVHHDGRHRKCTRERCMVAGDRARMHVENGSLVQNRISQILSAKKGRLVFHESAFEMGVLHQSMWTKRVFQKIWLDTVTSIFLGGSYWVSLFLPLLRLNQWEIPGGSAQRESLL